MNLKNKILELVTKERHGKLSDEKLAQRLYYLLNFYKPLQHGQMPVNRKALIEHCDTLHNALAFLDKTMLEKESFERGKKVAKVYNAIQLSLHRIEHFELKVDLKLLGTELPKQLKK